MGYRVFGWCGKLKTASLSSNLSTIPFGTFMYSALESFEVADGVQVIDEYAIEASKVIIPESVCEIKEYGVWASEIHGRSGTEAERYAISRNIKFVTDEVFHVVFKNDDGTILSEQDVPYGKDAKEPEIPKKESDNYNRYEFEGWEG